MSMAKRKVLYICHNHPEIRPGGAEAYAYEVHEAIRDGGEWESIFLARTGPPFSKAARYHDGTLLTGVNDTDPNQYFFYSELDDYDWFLGSSKNKPAITSHLRDFLLAHQPDVVHFQHTLFIGFEAIREVRNALPDATIVYTLHEFLPICHRHGQMVRTTTEKPCMEESPRRCHECFPDIAPQEFFMRKQFIQSHMSLVDLFIAPSMFLRDRYVDWGIPAEKIVDEDYGRFGLSTPTPVVPRKTRNRLGFFGQFSYYKGVNVVLKAMKRLHEEGVAAHVSLHGANLEIQPQEFQDEFGELLEASGDSVEYAGRYNHDQLPALMESVDWIIVPSIWWENSPLVIQEAFIHQRPVICSDIGGMAEKVTDGVDGLHFRAGDPESLANVIKEAVTTRRLWDTLRAGIKPIYAMDDHIPKLLAMYDDLIADKAGSTTTSVGASA
jgi:glycosyltransferase involved in cell wall biosynthesis